MYRKEMDAVLASKKAIDKEVRELDAELTRVTQQMANSASLVRKTSCKEGWSDFNTLFDRVKKLETELHIKEVRQYALMKEYNTLFKKQLAYLTKS